MSSLSVILDSELKEIKENKSNNAKQQVSLATQKKLDLKGKIMWSDYEHYEELDAGQSDNHLLNAFLTAYNRHLPLVLRPDDIHASLQMAIAICINNDPERYRDLFVAHSGQKTLKLFDADFDLSWLTSMFGKAIQENFKDPEFAKKFTPTYSTTSPLISSVSHLTLMNTVKAYFKYEFILCCGIPNVVLSGTREDWLALKTNYEFLKTFLKDSELKDWFKHFDVLINLLTDMRCLKDSGSAEATTEMKELWKRVITFTPVGSGGNTRLGGWVRLLIPYSTNNKLIRGLNEPIPCLETKDISQEEEKRIKDSYLSGGWSSISSWILYTPLKITDHSGEEYQTEVSSGFFPCIILNNQVHTSFGVSIALPRPEKDDKNIFNHK